MPEQNNINISNELATGELLLGRKPKLPYKVVSRCADNTPQVFQTDPVYFEDDRWKPFPTYLWLVCPRLRYEVAKLEAEGAISVFIKRLETEATFRKMFLEGQELIRQERLKIAESITGCHLKDYLKSTLLETNIAGSRNPLGVKCLHAHTAQALVFGSNPIGDEVLAQVGRCDKTKECGKTLCGGKVEL